MVPPKSVQIPYETFQNLLWIFESMDIESYSDDFGSIIRTVQQILLEKQYALNRREAYSQLRAASDLVQKKEAQVNYFMKTHFPDMP